MSNVNCLVYGLGSWFSWCVGLGLRFRCWFVGSMGQGLVVVDCTAALLLNWLMMVEVSCPTLNAWFKAQGRGCG